MFHRREREDRREQSHRTLKVLELTRATAPLVDYAAEVDKEPVIATRGGRPGAALVAVENTDLETVALVALFILTVEYLKWTWNSF
jgi:hypothetical protein